MMKKLIAVLVLVPLLLTSCIVLAADDDDGAYYSATTSSDSYVYSDGNTYIEVHPKTTQWLTHDATAVYVNLDANGSTGYQWVATIDGRSIYLDSQSYTTPDYYPGLVGASGIWNAVFETSGYDGTSYVTLKYVRSWDEANPAETHYFSVTAYYGTISDVTILY